MADARRISRRMHKFLAMAVGLQLLVWSASGFYMVVIPIEVIHGDMLVSQQQHALEELVDELSPVSEVLARYPQATEITLLERVDGPIYRLALGEDSKILDAVTADPLAGLTARQAARVAGRAYRGDAPVSAVTLIESDPPTEIQFAPLPLWRVDFDDRWGTSFYIDPQTGKFMTRRHTLWRIFDALWMLHIMDYQTREDINNVALRGFSIAALLLALSGGWLLYTRFSAGKGAS